MSLRALSLHHLISEGCSYTLMRRRFLQRGVRSVIGNSSFSSFLFFRGSIDLETSLGVVISLEMKTNSDWMEESEIVYYWKWAFQNTTHLDFDL
jgi:hypothetical protein